MNYRALFRFAVFLVIAGFFGVMEINTLTGPHTGTTDTYHAIFGGTDGVSGLHAGNPVRVSGVAVGKVSDVHLVDARHAKVTFTANRNQAITSHTYATVRYANLLGQRYLALSRSSAGGTPLAPNGTIPMSRTAPALSLTDLFNGFRPLFSALSPQQVNELSQDIIDVLQGQTDRVEDLISRTADLTRNLADRDQTFGTVLDSLSTLLSTVSKHDDQLASVVTTLHAFTAQLHSDGPAVLDSLNAVDQLVGSAAGLFQNLEDHNLPADVADAASLTKVLGGNTGTLAKLLSGFSAAFGTFARVSQNGNWINIYACNVGVETYGSVNILASQIVGALAGLLNGVAPGLGTVLNGILASLGLSTDGSGLLGGLIGNPKLDVPLKLPNGPVGGSTAHSAVCS